MKAILSANREAEAQNAMQLLVQIAEIEPTFFKDCIIILVDTMFAVSKAEQFEDSMALP